MVRYLNLNLKTVKRNPEAACPSGPCAPVPHLVSVTVGVDDMITLHMVRHLRQQSSRVSLAASPDDVPHVPQPAPRESLA